MSRALIREQEKNLHFESIAPEEVRKRARASQCSGLTSALLSKCLDSKSLQPSRSGQAASTLMQKKSSQQDLRQHGSSKVELRESVQAFVQANDPDECVSPGCRPIERKIKAEIQQEEPLSELCKSCLDEDFVPPHMLSFPAQSCSGGELYSRPGSLFEGAGRKLRGMDAVRFRRNVMRQTGFLESSTENVVQ